MAENLSSEWIPCARLLPPAGEVVMTKIDDAQGCRNEVLLMRSGRLWFVPDGRTYCYYEPTHWKPMGGKS